MPFYVPPPGEEPIPAYLGLDIGSVSTNVVVIDDMGAVIHDVYLRTAGRPIEAVQQGLAEVERLWGSRLEIRGVGTTGSGRELIAEFVGADAVNDEITAHKTGAIHISSTLGGEPVDTIFEIGGQDSKFISIERGVVVDFAMNEACAAGTGSFLEEQAEKLGISIKGEFAKLALSSPAPDAAGRTLHGVHGARRHRLAAQGRDRAQPRGGPGVFDRAELSEPGGARAQNRRRDLFPGRHRLQRRGHGGVRQPAREEDHGAALQRCDGRDRDGADRAAVASGDAGRDAVPRVRSRKLQLSTRDFVCKACSNLCDMKEFVIEGQKSYWGDKCSDKFRKPSPTGRKPVIEDLFALPRAIDRGVAECGVGEGEGRPAARDVDGRPAAVLEALLRGARHPDGALAGHRPAHLGRAESSSRWRSPVIRCRWRTATSRRCSKPARTISCAEHRRRRGGRFVLPRTTARGARRCRGCCALRRRSSRSSTGF